MTAVNECLILAAGNGSRIASVSGGVPKPLVPLRGIPLLEPKTAKGLTQQPLADGEVILAVDHNVDRVFDLDDATKVKCEADHIVDIGKDLARYDALDTGMFLCSPALFDRLESAKRDGNCSLSDGMRQLAQEQKLRAFDIGDAHWQDVDSPEALAHAESIFDVDFPENPLAESLVDA